MWEVFINWFVYPVVVWPAFYHPYIASTLVMIVTGLLVWKEY